MKHLKLICIVVLASFCAVTSAKKIVNCYYGTWAGYRPGNGQFDASHINPHLCTHISYSFFGIEPSGQFKSLDTWMDLDSGKGMIRRTLALKQANPSLKVLAVVGGWNEGSPNYSAMAADPNKRKLFISSALQFIQQHGFDGLDVDWEYPARMGGRPEDKQNFVTLLKELSEALKPLNLELGIAVASNTAEVPTSYDIPNISKYVDFINVMTYDLHDESRLSFNAPLKGQRNLNVEDSIKFWLQQGAPASKLLLGLAFYGHHYTYSQQPTPGSPISGKGNPGPITQQPGYIGYHEICNMIKSSYTTKFDETHGVPYSYNGNQWIGYDNVRSIEMKVDLVNSLNLGGAMVWSIEMDDFRGECGEKNPLLNAINRKLGNGSSGSGSGGSQTHTTRRPVQKPVATAAPTIPIRPSGSSCTADGFYAHETDCTHFFRCVGGTRYDQVCPAGLKFDIVSTTCTWPNQANCGH